jgi:hypothetical protein
MSTKKIKGDLQVENDVQVDNVLKLPANTAERVLTVDASGNVASSTVTETELGYVSGVTSDVQTQLNAKVPNSEKGAANGVATLDGSGKVPASQMQISLMEFQGSYNATTNSPTLADTDTDKAGDVYRVATAGTQDFGAGNITFGIGDWVYNDGSAWQKLDGVDPASTDELTEGATNKYYTAERAQDDVGGSLTDSASVDFTYDDGAGTITADVLPAGVDHDSLNNFVGNEHIDHSGVNINTNADSGLSGGGDITASRSLTVDIAGTTLESSVADDDEILIYDTSAGALRSMTKANFVGDPGSSAGDINETSFSMANNVTVATNVTSLAFANGTVRSFEALVSVQIDATGDLFEVFKLQGIQKGASWDMSVESTGDNSQAVFTITSAGQVQYTSGNIAGFVSGTMKFRAITTSV